jgi:hypothetical protein
MMPMSLHVAYLYWLGSQHLLIAESGDTHALSVPPALRYSCRRFTLVHRGRQRGWWLIYSRAIESSAISSTAAAAAAAAAWPSPNSWAHPSTLSLIRSIISSSAPACTNISSSW